MTETKKILIVAKDHSVRSSLEKFLKKEDYQVEKADNGDHLREKLEGNQFSLILLDMDAENGEDDLAIIKENYPEFPLLAMVSSLYRGERMSGKVKDFLIKPLNIGELKKKIREIMERK